MSFFTHKEKKEFKIFFKPSLKKFSDFIKSNSNLKRYSESLNSDFGKNLINFMNHFIFAYINDEQIQINKDEFDLAYQTVLKATCLLALALINKYTENIFKYDFHGKHNPYEFTNHGDLTESDSENFKVAYNNIYSFILYLYELIQWKIPFELFYEFFYNVIILLFIRADLFIKKQYLFIVFFKPNYTQEKTSNYLRIFKKVRMMLQEILPTSFNDLIFIINSYK